MSLKVIHFCWIIFNFYYYLFIYQKKNTGPHCVVSCGGQRVIIYTWINIEHMAVILL